MTATRAPALYESSPRVSRFNAWFFDAFDSLIDLSLRRFKRQIFRDLPSEIVEIGPGVGASFRYYRPGTRVIAIEPNQAMHPRLRQNAVTAGVILDLRDSLAEDTGLDPDSAEAVVSSLVLCTVTDQAAAIEECRRILRPGGRLIFVEHVRGRGPVLRALQASVHRPWRWLFEGCDLDRRTNETIERAGFSRVEATTRAIATVFLPINALTYGEAVK